jgi:hypothetical protein
MEIKIDGFKNSNKNIVHLSTHSPPQGKSMEFLFHFFKWINLQNICHPCILHKDVLLGLTYSFG